MNRGRIVSVIITTKNEEDVIGRLVESVRKQTYRQAEIIIVDNYSIDKTIAIAKKMGARIYILGPERSAQRNFGARNAKGEYFLFLDADMELTPNVLKDCVEIRSKDKKIGAVVIPEESKAHTFWEKVKAFERSFYNESGDEATDAARFFTKEAFLKAGGYDETITGPEDWDLPENVRKLGFKTGRINAVIYHYEKIASLFELVRKKFYYALRSHRYLSKQKISVISPKTIYFLRPVFYRHFDKILTHPVLSLGMMIMFTFELIGGGLGYLKGRLRKL